jgi:hypothetical protein
LTEEEPLLSAKGEPNAAVWRGSVPASEFADNAINNEVHFRVHASIRRRGVRPLADQPLRNV